MLQSLLYQKHTETQPTAALLGRVKGTGQEQEVPVKAWPILPYGVNATAETAQHQGLALTLWLTGSEGLAAVGGGENHTLLQAGGVALRVIIGREWAILELELVDATSQVRYAFRPDAECTRWLNLPGPHYAGFAIDAGARIASVVVDGVLCDGGAQEWSIHPEKGDNFQGFGFVPANVSDFNSGSPPPLPLARVGAFSGEVSIYGERCCNPSPSRTVARC